MNSVIKSQAQQHAYEFESNRHFVGKTVYPVESTVVFGNEHVQVRVEDGLCYQCKVFVFHSALVSSFLSNKLYSQRISQILLYLSHLFHGVIEQMIPPDGNAEKDESLDSEIVAIKVEILNEGGKSSFHIFFNVHFLFVDGLDLHQFVLVIEVQQEGVVHKVKLSRLAQVDLKLLDRLKELCQKLAIELFYG